MDAAPASLSTRRQRRSGQEPGADRWRRRERAFARPDPWSRLSTAGSTSRHRQAVYRHADRSGEAR